jgi:signal peptidase I
MGRAEVSVDESREQRSEGPRAESGSKVRKRRSAVRTIVEIVVIVAAAFILAMLIQLFLVKPFTIPTGSMEPTLMISDRVLVNRFILHFREPKPGDIVVFRSPMNPKEDLIKRVVAVGGDTVSVHDGALYVNSQRRVENYLMDKTIVGTYPETVVPAGSYFLMGDNRNNSGDSRVFGAVAKNQILGKAFAIYWPIRRWHWF